MFIKVNLEWIFWTQFLLYHPGVHGKIKLSVVCNSCHRIVQIVRKIHIQFLFNLLIVVNVKLKILASPKVEMARIRYDILKTQTNPIFPFGCEANWEINKSLLLPMGSLWSCTDSFIYVEVNDPHFTNAPLSDVKAIMEINVMNVIWLFFMS